MGPHSECSWLKHKGKEAHVVPPSLTSSSLTFHPSPSFDQQGTTFPILRDGSLQTAPPPHLYRVQTGRIINSGGRCLSEELGKAPITSYFLSHSSPMAVLRSSCTTGFLRLFPRSR